MAGANFIRKTNVAESWILPGNDRPAIADHPRLVETVAARCGRGVAGLFAEPVATPGADGTPQAVSWYGEEAGEARPLSSFDADARRQPEGELRDALTRLAPLLDDPATAPLLGAALHVSSPDDILVVNGHPVLTGWGVLPAHLRGDEAARARHFAATLGPYAPFPAPPIGARAAAAPLAGAAAVPPVTPPPGTATTDPEAEVRTTQPWRPVMIATLVAAAMLVFLLLPGVLMHLDARVADAPPVDDRALAMKRASNDALEQEIARLERAVGAGICSRDGELTLPPDERVAMPPGPDGTPAPSSPDAPALALKPPPAPEVTPVPPETRPDDAPFAGTLVDLLEASTLFILGFNPETESVSFGTGFVIAPGVVVTNWHVVMNAPKIVAGNKTLGAMKPARVVHSSGPGEPQFGGPDFAVLEVPDAKDLPVLVFNSRAQRLMDVTAAGFPGLLLRIDDKFRRLMETGDVTAIPSMVVTQGVVTVIQNEDRYPIVSHTAAINRGNSGGPLADACGRLIGVNTFKVAKDGDGADYALSTVALRKFLDEKKVAYTTNEERCDPLPRVADARPAPTAPAPAPAPGAAPSPPPGTGTPPAAAPAPGAAPAPAPAR